MEKKKMVKTREQLVAEQAEIEALRTEVQKLVNKVPQSVLGGSYQVAVTWKEKAMDAYRLSTSKAPTADKLRNARDMLIRAANAPV